MPNAPLPERSHFGVELNHLAAEAKGRLRRFVFYVRTISARRRIIAQAESIVEMQTTLIGPAGSTHLQRLESARWDNESGTHFTEGVRYGRIQEPNSDEPNT